MALDSAETEATKQFGVLVALELVMTAIVGVDSKEK